MDITAALRSALDHEAIATEALVTRQHADNLAAELATALDALGFTIKKKPASRKPAAPAEVFAPNTGNPELDAFMQRKHRHDWRARLQKAISRNRPGMIPMPPPAPGHTRRPLTATARQELYEAHNVIHHSN